jgi:hypothetical protein
LETAVGALPNMTTLLSRITSLETAANEHTTTIASTIESLDNAVERIIGIEKKITSFEELDERLTVVEQALESLQELIELSILPISNEMIGDILEEV